MKLDYKSALFRALEKVRDGMVVGETAGWVRVNRAWFEAHAPPVPDWWEGGETEAEWREQFAAAALEAAEELVGDGVERCDGVNELQRMRLEARMSAMRKTKQRKG